MASQWIGRGLFLQAAGLSFAAGALTVAGGMWLLPRFGVTGAVYTTLGVYALATVGNGAMASWVQRRWRTWTLTATDRTGTSLQSGNACA
jgi:hypothetical protein